MLVSIKPTMKGVFCRPHNQVKEFKDRTKHLNTDNTQGGNVGTYYSIQMLLPSVYLLQFMAPA